jgi:hypothetical protein
MYARVARWEGADGETMRSSAKDIRSRAESGPPEGVPATGFLLLTNPDEGTALAISLFDTEEDRRAGDETLNSMTPPGEGMGTRTSVEMYEVAVEVKS